MGFCAPYTSHGLTAAVLVVTTGLAGCDEQIAGYLPVSSIARDGFASDQGATAKSRGR